MLNKRLKEWRLWGLTEEPRLVKTFTAGKNHHTALIRSKQKHYVLKVFEHSFEQAINAQRWAAKHRLAPDVIYAEGSLALMDYIESNDNTNDFDSLAAALGTLHTASPPELEPFNLMEFCEGYLKSAPQQYHADHITLQPALDVFLNDSTPWVACHNDLVRENCLFGSQRAWFIDWEYAMLHNPWFDLAAIILYFDLTNTQAKSFLEHYQEGWGEYVGQPIFFASQLALLWGDLLWHIDKFGPHYRHQHEHRFDKLQALAAVLTS